MKILVVLIIAFISLFTSSCLTSVSSLVSFSDTGLSNQYKYKGIPILKFSKEQESQIMVNYIQNNGKAINTNYKENVVLQVFVNRYGKISKVFKVKTLNPECDKLALESIKKVKFPKNYSLVKGFSFFVSYTFDDKEKIFPVLNGFFPKVYEGDNKTLKKIANIVDYDDLEIKPKLIKGQSPIYPEITKNAGLEGKVFITVVIDEFGNVVDATAGDPTYLLIEPSIEAAYQFKFNPGYYKNKPVKVIMDVPFNYKLN